MNKNQKTYVLLAAVVVIWGAIGYQIYGYLNPSTPEIPPTVSERFTPKGQVKEVTYTIKPDYRDPFFGKIYRKPKPKKKKVHSKQQIIFPSISYDGIVNNGNTKTFLISINGSQEIFKVKDRMSGVELIKGNNQEITLKYKGETKKYSIGQ